MKEVSDKDIPYRYPSDIPKIYSTGAFGGYSTHDFRLMFYNEIPYKQDEILPSKDIKVFREVETEIMMSPLVAKELVIWLAKKVEKYEEIFGEIPGPKIMDKIKIEKVESEEVEPETD